MTRTATATANTDDQLTAKELITQFVEFSTECDATAQAKEEALNSLIDHLNNLNRVAQTPDTPKNSEDNHHPILDYTKNEGMATTAPNMEKLIRCTDISTVMGSLDSRAIANNTNIKGNNNTVTNSRPVYNSITVYNTEALILLKERNEALRSQLHIARQIIGRLTGEIMRANTEMLDFLAEPNL